MAHCELRSRQLNISSTGRNEARSRVASITCRDASASAWNPIGKRSDGTSVGTRTHAQRVCKSHRDRQFDAFTNRTPQADPFAEENQHYKVGGGVGDFGKRKEAASTGSGAELVPGRRSKTSFVTSKNQKQLKAGLPPSGRVRGRQ